MSNETSRFNPNLNVIDLNHLINNRRGLDGQSRKNDFKVNAYEIDKFTMTWENLGLSCEGTLQIEQALEYYDAT